MVYAISFNSSARIRPNLSIFFFNDTATTEIYTLSLHDALPIWGEARWTFSPVASAEPAGPPVPPSHRRAQQKPLARSEGHNSEIPSPDKLLCPLFLVKKKQYRQHAATRPSKTSILYYIDFDSNF